MGAIEASEQDAADQWASAGCWLLFDATQTDKGDESHAHARRIESFWTVLPRSTIPRLLPLRFVPCHGPSCLQMGRSLGSHVVSVSVSEELTVGHVDVALVDLYVLFGRLFFSL
jgi:hypothetical protein